MVLQLVMHYEEPLMTSVPGAAIVSVKIDGADHEFSVFKGVLEDVSDIILNLKGVIFKIINDGPEQFLYL